MKNIERVIDGVPIYRVNGELKVGKNGFQSSQIKNPDGTVGPKWDLVSCGKGCVISPGCFNCPAAFESKLNNNRVQCRVENLFDPVYWKVRKHVFATPEGDPFHEDVPDEYLHQIFAVMEYCAWHRFIFLSKRHERMVELLSNDSFYRCMVEAGKELFGRAFQSHGVEEWGRNVLIGVSVENQKWLDRRSEVLEYLPHNMTKIIFVSPMLGPMHLSARVKASTQWLVCGGERGGSWCKKPRPCKLEWQIDLANQYDGPFFLLRHHDRRWIQKWNNGTGRRSFRAFPEVMRDF
ncbi:MAG: DUF5131 family protein [bacterium]